jgi:UDP-N-acetyl-D-glucosamine dehydrogenase
VKRLNAGDSPIEDVSDDALADAVESGRYRATYNPDDIAGFDVAIISVPTPLKDGAPDLSYIARAGETVARHLTQDACVVLESTTYPGTTEEFLAPILEECSGLVAGRDFALGYSPERIDPGNPKYSLVNTPKIVSGIDQASLAAVQGFFDDLVETTVAVDSPKEAELAKLLENTFRHVNIALVNEMAMFANDLGINIWQVIDAASTKPFGFTRFEPGPGVGGHCLPIDPSYLSWRVRRSLGHTFRFVELANDVNEHMPDYVVRRLVVALNARGLAVNGRTILVLGLSYKKNTGDAREAPARQILRLLSGLGAELHVVDPYVGAEWVPTDVTRVDLSAEEVSGADAVLLLVDHDEFDLRLLERAQLVFDTRRRVTGQNVEHL